MGISLATLVFLLWDEHRAHLLSALPWQILLGACLLMHVLMHGGHDDHKEDRDE